ncbi:MAG: carboxylesterase family protein, partial [Flavisolibacter sp.]
MKTITRIIAFLVTIIALAFNSEVKAQSVLNPADPIVTYSSANPPAQPAYGQIGKWVRTKRLNWNTDAYKAYFYKGSPFRVKFPKSYLHEVADGKTYPMIIMFHGRGEAGTIYDNEYSLYHGGQTHLNAVNNDKFDGFVFYMQNQGGSWGEGHYNIIAELIDYMITNNKVDPFRVSVHGLSFGGEGAWKMTIRKPTYVAASLPMSNASIYYRDDKETLKWIPMWVFQGGLDGNPAPATTIQVRDAILNVGGNFKYTLYPNLGHGTWNTAYAEADFFPYMLRAHKANP